MARKKTSGRAERPGLGALELEVLRVICDDQPCTVSHVAEVMARRKGLARTTVLTVMQRLVAKGFARRSDAGEAGPVHQYSATRKIGRVVSGLIDQFVTTVLDGSALPIVSYLVENEAGLTGDEIEALRRIAARLEVESEEGAQD